MRLFLLGLAIGLCLLLLFFGLGIGGRTGQPISFDHKRHQEQGIECLNCHPHYKDQTFSGMPTLTTCLECHKDPLTQSTEEERIRQFEKRGQEIPWRRLYGQPDHVFFSHRRHVTLGRLECQQCHGNIGQSEKPPASPWVKMTMRWCMDCHTAMKVTNDCLVCHV